MKRMVYIGTYTQQGHGMGHRAEGIYRFFFDAADGSLTFAGATSGVLNPSFLAVHPNRRYLYAANELSQGAVSAFSIQPSDGSLIFLNSQSTNGAHPCYISCDPSGSWLLAANYSSGSLAVFPILPDGSLGERTGFIQHAGRLGPIQARQEHPHAHSIRFDPSGKFILAADLGLDQMRVYRLNPEGSLTPNDPPHCQFSPGAGPRHFEFSADGGFLYVANELNSTIVACAWDSRSGMIAPFQILSTLPPGFKSPSTVADIHRTPDGAYLYVSNRGHDSLAIFAVAPRVGHLKSLGFVSTQGKTPRNFAVEPSGKFLFVANQDSDNLVAFRIDPASGSLTPTGSVVSAPKPVCILFVDLEEPLPSTPAQ